MRIRSLVASKELALWEGSHIAYDKDSMMGKPSSPDQRLVLKTDEPPMKSKYIKGIVEASTDSIPKMGCSQKINPESVAHFSD
jgi:hypothetical protein